MVDFINAALEVSPVMVPAEMLEVVDDQLSVKPEYGLVCFKNDLCHCVSPFPRVGCGKIENIPDT